MDTVWNNCVSIHKWIRFGADSILIASLISTHHRLFSLLFTQGVSFCEHLCFIFPALLIFLFVYVQFIHLNVMTRSIKYSAHGWINVHIASYCFVAGLRSLMGELDSSGEAVTPLMFLQRMFTCFPRFAEKGEHGGFTQQARTLYLRLSTRTLPASANGTSTVWDFYTLF